MMPMGKKLQDTIILHARINPREICFLTDILEGYPGFVLMRTDDAKKGLIQFWIAPDFQVEVMEILNDLKDRLNLVFLEK
jgi:hypothetical protein